MYYQINVLTYNRPIYLNRVLEALKLNNLGDCEIHIWIDGPSPSSIQSNNTIELQELNLRTCYNNFPTATIHQFNTNQGIGMMYKMMYENTFSDKQAGIFIEDDFVPGPDYISILKILDHQTRHRYDIGNITAYGPDRFVSPIEQKLRYTELERSIPNWGYLLTKKMYEEHKPLMDQYWPLIEGINFRDKDINLMQKEFMSKFGFPNIKCTSQDAAEAIAITVCGQVKLSTITRNATYIGAQGEHLTKAEYDAGYYSKDGVYSYSNLKTLQFDLPSVEKISYWNKILKETGTA